MGDFLIVDENGDTVLHLMCSIGQQKPVIILLANKANPNTPNSSGQTPLHYAAKAGQVGSEHIYMFMSFSIYRMSHRS